MRSNSEDPDNGVVAGAGVAASGAGAATDAGAGVAGAAEPEPAAPKGSSIKEDDERGCDNSDAISKGESNESKEKCLAERESWNNPS